MIVFVGVVVVVLIVFAHEMALRAGRRRARAAFFADAEARGGICYATRLRSLVEALDAIGVEVSGGVFLDDSSSVLRPGAGGAGRTRDVLEQRRVVGGAPGAEQHDPGV